MNLSIPATAIVRPQSEVDAGLRAGMYRRARRGDLVKLAPNAYVAAADWAALHSDDQYRLRIRAVAQRLGPKDVVSHWSAASLWQLPLVGQWPATVHVTNPTVHEHGRSTTVLRRHAGHRPDPWRLEGLPVTTLAETVVDVARVAPFATAVAMGDAALWRHEHRGSRSRVGVTHAQLEHAWESLDGRRGVARARRVLDFIDGRADRPGESLSRVTMHLLGVPAPVLQHRLVTPLGKVYYLDFYWPEFNIGGDFDGRVKYIDPAFRGGRSAEEVVYDEKVREDEVRLMVDGHGRWDYTVAGSRQLLAERLLRIGLRW